MTELALTEHLFRFRQADALLGGFWDDERVPPALAESMAELLEVPRHGRPRRVRGVRAGGQGRRPARRHRPGGRLLRGPHGRRGPACSAGYPFDVLLGSVHWVGGWRFDDLDDPVSMDRVVGARGRRLLGRLHRGLEELAASGACDVLAHPDLIKVGRATSRTRRPSGGTASPRRRRPRAWRRSCRSSGWRKPVGEQYPAQGLLERFVARGVPAHHGVGRPPSRPRGRPGRRPARRCWPRSGSASCRGTGPGPARGAGGAHGAGSGHPAVERSEA